VDSTVVPALKTVGEALAEIVVDGVNAGPVVTLVVPDDAQRPDISSSNLGSLAPFFSGDKKSLRGYDPLAV